MQSGHFKNSNTKIQSYCTPDTFFTIFDNPDTFLNILLLKPKLCTPDTLKSPISGLKKFDAFVLRTIFDSLLASFTYCALECGNLLILLRCALQTHVRKLFTCEHVQMLIEDVPKKGVKPEGVLGLGAKQSSKGS